MMRKVQYSLLFSLLFIEALSFAQTQQNPVFIIGEMRNVMQKGELQGRIHLDTISNKNNLFGLGPIEYLRGEIMIWNGTSFISRVESDSSMNVTSTFDIKAPFLGYSRVQTWQQTSFPDSVRTLKQLEHFLHENHSQEKPFFFRLEGIIDSATIHVVHLPVGSTVSKPKDAHIGQVDYNLYEKSVLILGFYSEHHKAILTHHDTNLHIHLLTSDQKFMGHVDKLYIKAGSVSFFLPKD